MDKGRMGTSSRLRRARAIAAIPYHPPRSPTLDGRAGQSPWGMMRALYAKDPLPRSPCVV